MAAWDSADLSEKFLMYLGRGNGGTMEADELWTSARVYTWLADAQESVYADLAPMAPHAFVLPPVALTTSDGGVTYTFPSSAFPFAHVEVYAQESGGRTLFASTYGDIGGDFVIEGALIRAPGNRVRTYSSGPYARYSGFPARLSDSVAPSLEPDPARELILWKALENATEVAAGAMDPTPWREKYTQALRRWTIVFQTQYQTQGQAAAPSGGPWWLTLDALNGA